MAGIQLWEKYWYDFAAMLLMDAIEQAHDCIVACQTVKQVSTDPGTLRSTIVCEYFLCFLNMAFRLSFTLFFLFFFFES